MIINDLPTLSSPQTGDELPIERGTTTYKIDYNALATAIISKLGDPVGVTHGGSGLTASPSLLVNLASTSAANVMQASPRPGVTGTLPVARGGLGATTGPDGCNNIGASQTIAFETTDTTAALINAKLDTIPVHMSATVYIPSAVLSVLTDGKASAVAYGVVCKAASNDYRFTVNRLNGLDCWSFQCCVTSTTITPSTVYRYLGTAL